MPLTKPMDDRSGLVRRSTTRRPSQYVGLDDNDPAALTGDYMSVAGSDRTGDGGGGLMEAETLAFELDDNQQRMKAFNEFANRTLMPDEKDLMLRKFEKAVDLEFGRTYELGRPLFEVSSPTSLPHVAIVLLPGADLWVIASASAHAHHFTDVLFSLVQARSKQIRTGQHGLGQTRSKRRRLAGWDCWRNVSFLPEIIRYSFTCIARLTMTRLSNISVTGDLQLNTKDITALVANNALCRMIQESEHKRQYRNYSRIAVTIQSENVEIVNEFSQACKAIDLSATLIEVDVSSLFILMVSTSEPNSIIVHSFH